MNNGCNHVSSNLFTISRHFVSSISKRKTVWKTFFHTLTAELQCSCSYIFFFSFVFSSISFRDDFCQKKSYDFNNVSNMLILLFLFSCFYIRTQNGTRSRKYLYWIQLNWITFCQLGKEIILYKRLKTFRRVNKIGFISGLKIKTQS